MAKREFLAGVVALSHEYPKRFLHLMREAWPEIKAAMDQGHTLKVIHQRLVDSGLKMTYRCFTMHVRRLRKENLVLEVPKQVMPPATDDDKGDLSAVVAKPEYQTRPEQVQGDPYETIRQHLQRKQPGFQWDEDAPDARKLY